jgi:hypothetical protein
VALEALDDAFSQALGVLGLEPAAQAVGDRTVH